MTNKQINLLNRICAAQIYIWTENALKESKNIPDILLKIKPRVYASFVINRFNDEERAIMDSHAQLGFNMIKNSERPLLKAAAIVAHQHHEKWDGSGYPQKLQGQEIHIYGRITAVADVFDALSHERVYKKAWEMEKVLEFLKAQSGKSFEPKLVDIFLENIDAIIRIKHIYNK